MNDKKIIDLYWERNEDAIKLTKQAYGRYCYSIAYHILHNKEDAQECENDTYLDAWNTMPPQRPTSLSAYLGMITRRISLDRYRFNHAKKRGSGEIPLSLSELDECIPADATIGEEIAQEALAELLSAFLWELRKSERNVFLRRYFYCDSIREISHRYGYTQGKVKMILLRTRQKLLTVLQEKGVFL